MWFHVLLVIITIICDQAADAQCFSSSFRCQGATTSGSSFEDCCRPVVASNNLERSFSSIGGCYSCIVLGLDQIQYTLAERSTFYSLRLRLLSPANTLFLRRPRLRLFGVPGTASVDDFRVVSSDILIQSAAGLDVAVTISDDGIAGEPMENLTITSQPPLVSGSSDARFLFRDSVVNIIDSDEPIYQFDQSDYVTTEGPNAHIEVVVQQIVQSVRDVHLLLTPLTYAQYIARSNQSNSTLAPIDQFHGSRPSNAHHEDNRQDFNKTVRRVFFPANSGVGAERRVDFPVFDDVVDEDPEGFIIVLDVDRSLTDVAVAFTPNLRTTLGRISDDDPFFFGFEQEEFVYNERRDEGTQDIVYSPAPGNKTEKTFTFALNLNALQGAFTFGTNGDISFGSNIIRPTFQFVGTLLPPSPPVRTLTFDVNRDDILEGREIGLLTIAPSTSFDGFVPRFQAVRIIIDDSNSATVNLSAPLIVPEEDRSFLANISLIGPSGGTTIPLEIDINDIEITATRFDDYLRFAPPSVVFQGVDRPGCCLRTVLYDVTDDNIAEPDETLTLSIVRSLASNQIPLSYIVQRVNVTIVDDDMAIIGFENISVSVQEGAGFAVLYVAVLNGALGRDVTVRFSTADLSATAGSDYNSTIRILTFSSSRTRIPVQVPIVQDQFTERTEQFRASLSLVNDNGINVTVTPHQATVNIIDDDSLIIGFVEDLVTVNEADMFASLTVRILIGSLVQGATALVGFSTADASAQSPGDYRNVSQQLQFTSSVSEFRVNISIINDALVEDVEHFVANLSLISAAVRVTINPPQATVNIRSDDRLRIGFAATRYSEREGLSVVPVVRILSGELPPGLSVPVIFNTANFQAVAPGDYSPTTQVLRFTSVNTSYDVIVPLRLDFFYEANEIFFGDLQLQSTLLDVIVDPSRANLSIIDNNRLDIGFAVADVQVPESAGDAVLTVELTGSQLNTSVQIQFNTVDGTALAGSDYNSTSGTITFTPGATTQTIRIPIINDRRLENNETFTVRLSNAPTRVSLSPDQATVTILDDDNVVIGFDPVQDSFPEESGQGEVTVRILSGELERDVAVLLSTASGTAESVADFSPLQNRRLVFSASQNSSTISFNIVNDILVEDDETLTASIQLAMSVARVSLAPNQAVLTITDTDRAVIGFTMTSYTQSESAGRIVVMVRVTSGDLGKNFSVLLDTSNHGGIGNILGSGSDLVPLRDINLEFSQTTTLLPVTITLEQDMRLENNEQFQARLVAAVQDPDITIDPGVANLTIVDDDSAIIGFDELIYNAAEGGTVDIVFSLRSGRLNVEVPVDLTISPRTASAGDYSCTNRGPYIFDNRNTRFTVRCTITQDAVVEGSEEFDLRLLSSTTFNVSLSPDRTIVRIQDDDRTQFAFQRPLYMFSEGDGMVNVTIIRTGESDIPQSIMISGSLQPGQGVIDRQVTFPPGVRSVSVQFNIMDDNIALEEVETLMFQLMTIPGQIGTELGNLNRTVVRIMDDDMVEITIVAPPMVREDAGMVQVIVTLSTMIASPLDVPVMTRPANTTDSAQETEDFIPITTVLRFEAGGPLSLSFNDSITNDNRVEVMVEPFVSQFSIPASSRFADSIMDLTGQATTEIIDDDDITIGFVNDPYSAPEGDGGVNYIVQILRGRLARAVTIMVSDIPGTAARGTDYNGVSETIVFDQDTNQTQLRVTFINDGVLEPNERLQLLLNSSDDNVILNPETAEVNILDDDEVTIGLEMREYRTSEDDRVVEVCALVRNGTIAPSRTVTVTLQTRSGSATGGGQDYVDATSMMLQFSSTSSKSCVNITIVNDNLYENTESFRVALNTSDPDAVLTPDEATVIIDDNNNIRIGWIEPAVTVREDVGSRNVCFHITSGMRQSDVVIDASVRTQEGTARAGADYINDTMSYSWPASEAQQCYPFRPVNDAIVERTEQLRLILTSTSPRVMVAPAISTVMITDEDIPAFMFERPTYAAFENNRSVDVCVVTTSVRERNVDVVVETRNGSATEGVDFVRLAETITFTPQQTSHCVTINLTNDSLVEGAEMFPVTIQNTQGIQAGPDTHVSILDIGTVTVGFDPTTYRVNESDGSVAIIIRVLKGMLAKQVNLSFSTENDAAQAPADFVAVQDRLIILDSEVTRVETNVSIVPDDRLEINENFFANLRLSASDAQVLISPNISTIEIIDDDAVTVGFIRTQISVPESLPEEDVCFNVSKGTLDREIVVNVRTQDETAQAPGDYTAGNMNFTLSPFRLRDCFTVRPNNDSIVEDDEQFTLRLSTTEMRVTTDPDTATITIVDNDRAMFRIEEPRYVANESDPRVEVCVVTNSQFERNITVSLTAINGTATSGEDFQRFENVELTFTTGVTRRCDYIIPINDNVTEGQEMFNVVLESPDPDVDTGPPSTVELIDRDSVVIGFVQTMYSEPESAGTIRLEVEVKQGSLAKPIGVIFSTADNTATAPSDYTNTTQILTFDGDNTRLPVTVPIVNDTRFENNEQFRGLLRLETPNTQVFVNPSEATVTIRDDDSVTVGFVRTEVSVNEDDETEDVCFNVRQGTLDREIVVTVQTQDGTARAPGDFAAGNMDFTLSPSRLSDCFTVRPNNDSIVEDDEQFTLRLSTTEMRVTTDPDTATITIIDNDRAMFRIEEPRYVANESDPQVEVCVVTNSQFERNITVSLTAINGTATSGEDFQRFENVELTFTSGVTILCAEIIPINDNVTEGQEMFQVELSSPDPDTDTGPPSTVVLVDGDVVVIGFAQLRYSANEPDGEVDLEIVVRMGRLATPVTVLFSTDNRTATAPLDFTAISNQAITLDADRMSQPVSVTIMNDTHLENDETFVGQIVLQGENNQVVIDRDETTVTIVDDDEITVGFIRTSVSVPENQAERDVCFRVLEGTLNRTIVVNVRSQDGQAIGGRDFASGSFNFTLDPSRTQDCFSVQPINDSIVEDNETFTLQLSTTADRVNTDPDTSTITIEDDDRALFRIQQPRYVVNETAPSVQVCVVTMNMFERALSVRLTANNGTALAGVDFVPFDMVITFSPGSNTTCVDIQPIPDSTTEGSESFPLVLTSTDPDVQTGPQSEVEIIDRNMVVIGFRQTMYAERESAGQVQLEVAVLMGQLAKPVTVLLSTSDGTASAPEDYTNITNRALMFNTNQMSVTEPVTIVFDVLLEGNETFVSMLRLQGVDPQVVIAPAVSTILIIDDDQIAVSFAQPRYSFDEDGVTGSVDVTLTGDIDVPVTVNVQGGPSTTPNIERSADGINTTITFQPGGPNVTSIPFNITDDDVALERDEIYTARLNIVSPSTGVAVGTFPTTDVIVRDDDTVNVGILNMTRINVTENVGTVRICLEKNAETRRSVIVTLSTQDNTATAPADYTSTTRQVSFPASANTVKCVDIPVNDDDNTEPTEDFRVVVTSNTTGVSVGPPSMVTVVIQDDDMVDMQICTLRPNLLLEPLRGVNSGSSTSYQFARGCEHRLVASNCDDDLDLTITVDFLPNNFNSGRINIMFEGHQIRILEDFSVNPPQSPNSSLIVYQNNASRVEIRLPTVPLTLIRSATELSVVLGSQMSGFADLSGLCGTPDGRLLFSDCRRVATTEGDDVNVGEFVESFRVGPAEQTLREQTAECGLIRNDTIVGDPLLTVPVHGNFSATGASSLSLCYEIHGSPDAYFNFVSDECTSVNAHYVAAQGASFLNVIDEISVLAVSTSGQCRRINVNLDTCVPQLNGMELPLVGGRRGPYESNGISIRVYPQRVRIAVPNCADSNLVMWVMCQNPVVEDPFNPGQMLGPIPMIKYVVSRGLNLQEYSHGLLGQFWNIPITVTKFTGQTRFNLPTENLYTVTVDHPRDPPRSFVGRLHDLTWEFNPTSCLYVGNRQAGPIAEVVSPNDPVIRGSYEQYRVSNGFDSMFDYSVFNSTRCL